MIVNDQNTKGSHGRVFLRSILTGTALPVFPRLDAPEVDYSLFFNTGKQFANSSTRAE
jgi:hypothetical protein